MKSKEPFNGFFNNPVDTRPRHGGWAPGNYTFKCHDCHEYYIGDKRATQCAPCSYGDAEGTLKERMMIYEGRTKYQYENSSIVVARIDGRGFSKLSKPLQKPFDPHFTKAMMATMHALVKETDATIGYTQSDEISLVWHTDNPEGQIFFNGKIQKLASVCASIATAHFNNWMFRMKMPINDNAYFDCRVFSVPSKAEAVNYLTYRTQDCTRNSISMAAHKHLGHKKLMNRNTGEQLLMLKEVGVDWDDYASANKYGTLAKRELYDTNMRDPQNPENIIDVTRSRIVSKVPETTFNKMYEQVFGDSK